MKARELLSRGGPVLGLLLVCAIFAFLIGPQFFRPVNLELIARQTAIVCTAALGMTVPRSAVPAEAVRPRPISIGRACLTMYLFARSVAGK